MSARDSSHPLLPGFCGSETKPAPLTVDAESGELIPLDLSSAPEPRVNLRNVHASLESKQQFTDWVKNRVEQCDLVKNQDYGVFDKFVKNSSGGRPTIEYWVTLDAAKEIPLMEGTAKGKEMRRYFIEAEKRWRATLTAPALPT